MEKLLNENELNTLRIDNRNAIQFNKNVTYLKKIFIEKRDILGKNLLGDKYDALFNDPIYGDVCSIVFTNGMMISCPHGNVIRQGISPFYCRGQNKDYGSCKASLFRQIDGESENIQIDKIFINNLKLAEFNNLLNQFKQVNEWPYGDVFTDAIAQHYGFETDMIDVTGDLEVALFFACCKHIKNNVYKPLTDEDILKFKYGVLFIREQDQELNDTLKDPINLSVYPIGYQPFTRCHKQNGSFVKTKIGEDLQTSGKFKLYKFKHSAKLSNEIYAEFDGGRSLFSYDELNSIEDLFDSIKNASTFSEDAFENVISSYGIYDSAEDYRNILKNKYGINIGAKPYSLSRNMKIAIENGWSIDKFDKQEKIAPETRIVYKPQ